EAMRGLANPEFGVPGCRFAAQRAARCPDLQARSAGQRERGRIVSGCHHLYRGMKMIMRLRLARRCKAVLNDEGTLVQRETPVRHRAALQVAIAIVAGLRADRLRAFIDADIM